MHRTALGALTAALALVVAALGVPVESAPADAIELTAAPVRAVVPVVVARPTRACRAGLIALTFDDGPSRTVTPGLVRTLLKHRVPATFFMVGSRIHSAPAAGRLVQNSGFLIGNHSWSHRQMTVLSDGAVRRELRSTRREMRAHGLVPSNLMRPPYGAISKRVGRDIHQLGLVPVLWSVDSEDWVGGTPRQIANRVLGAIRPHRTNIVLQHDGVTNSPNSVRAVPMIIKAAHKRGFCFTEIGPRGRMAVPVPALRATVASGTEDGPTPIRIRLDLDRPTTRQVSVRFRTAAGSATAGADFTSTVVKVVFPAGARSAWISVPVLDDGPYEPVEDVVLHLELSNGLTIARPELTASIFSDDVRPPGHP